MQNLERKIAALKAKLAPDSGASENEKSISRKILAAYEAAGHNIEIDEIEWRPFPFKGGPKNKEKKEFLSVIIRNLFNTAEMDGRKVLDDYAYNYEIQLTLAEYLEIKERFVFFWKHYQNEKKKHEEIFLRAYIGKNNLWAKPDEKREKEKESWTTADLERMRTARILQDTISRAEYNVRIEAPKQ